MSAPLALHSILPLPTEPLASTMTLCIPAVFYPKSLPPSTPTSPRCPLQESAPGEPIRRWGPQIQSWESQKPMRERDTGSKKKNLVGGAYQYHEKPTSSWCLEGRGLVCCKISEQRKSASCRTGWILQGTYKINPGWEQQSVENRPVCHCADHFWNWGLRDQS